MRFNGKSISFRNDNCIVDLVARRGRVPSMLDEVLEMNRCCLTDCRISLVASNEANDIHGMFRHALRDLELIFGCQCLRVALDSFVEIRNDSFVEIRNDGSRSWVRHLVLVLLLLLKSASQSSRHCTALTISSDAFVWRDCFLQGSIELIHLERHDDSKGWTKVSIFLLSGLRFRLF